MDTTLLTAMGTPDGRRVAVVAQNGEVKVWQLGPRRLVARLQIPGPHPLHSYSTVPPIVLDDSGELLAAGGEDGRVHVWRLEPLELLLTGTPTPPGAARKLPDGRLLMHMGTTPVTSLALSPDGETLTTSGGGMILLWDVPSGMRRDSMRLDGPVNGLAFSPITGLLVAGTEGWIHGIDPRRVRVEWLADTHLGQFSILGFAPSGIHILAADAHGVRLFDAHTRDEVCRIAMPYPQSASFSRNGRALVVGDGRRGVTVVDVATCQALARYEDFAGSVRAAWFRPGCGSFIAALNVAPRLYERRIPGVVEDC